MIGALGLGMIGMGVAFIWAGVKGRDLRAFFEAMRVPGPPPLGDIPSSEPAINPEAQGPPNPRLVANPRGIIGGGG